jgi:hypothetical protein
MFASLFFAAVMIGPLSAQQPEQLESDRPEAWAMKYFTSVALLSSFGSPQPVDPWALSLGIEGGWIPRLSEDQRRVGFNGLKTEDLNKTPVFGRLRLALGLPADFSVELGFVPPIELDGAQPTLFSAAVSRPIVVREAGRAGLRVYGQVGDIEGNFTCEEAGQTFNLGGPDFTCSEPSKDRTSQRYVGVELSGALHTGRWEPHLAMAANYMDLEFEVNSRYGSGDEPIVDEATLVADGWTFSLSAGLSYRATERLDLVGELFYSPLDVVRSPSASSETDGLFNVRALARWRVN